VSAARGDLAWHSLVMEGGGGSGTSVRQNCEPHVNRNHVNTHHSEANLKTVGITGMTRNLGFLDLSDS
jgi:hypothetical protein